MRMLIACLLFSFCTYPAAAQRTISMRTLYSRPQMHVKCGEFVVSFTIKDIMKAYNLMDTLDRRTFVAALALDTGASYDIEIEPGTNTAYIRPLEPLMQSGVGVYLLLSGHALVQKIRKHRKVETLEANISNVGASDGLIYVTFYYPGTKQIVFDGRMKEYLYYKDLGID